MVFGFVPLQLPEERLGAGADLSVRRIANGRQCQQSDTRVVVAHPLAVHIDAAVGVQRSQQELDAAPDGGVLRAERGLLGECLDDQRRYGGMRPTECLPPSVRRLARREAAGAVSQGRPGAGLDDGIQQPAIRKDPGKRRRQAGERQQQRRAQSATAVPRRPPCPSLSRDTCPRRRGRAVIRFVGRRRDSDPRLGNGRGEGSDHRRFSIHDTPTRFGSNTPHYTRKPPDNRGSATVRLRRLSPP